MANKETNEQKTWMPSIKWLCKSFLVIMVCLVIMFFALNFLLKPYMRDIPSEITPWLNNSQQQTEKGN
ncbi:MAG: hypothetical protein II669_04200 [Elusimicrobia bacterium]|jgi:hypothetical protein|nr:hypothetical protein [Elusimicrobiota bacterium]MBR4632696.1 hypothetical protein [Elusimicrobiota bacterium]